MVWFFIVAALLAVTIVALIVWPILRTHSIPQDQRAQQNVTIARDRLRQLQEEVDRGLVAPDQVQLEQSEIEAELLEDVSAPHSAAVIEPTRQGWWGGIVVAVAVPLLTGTLYLALGEPAAVSTPTTIEAQEQAGHSEADILNMVRALEQRLAESPDDSAGWYMLGNSYMTLQQFDKAASVFGKLRELTGDDPDLMVRQADALAMTQGGVLAGEPEQLILAALEQRPDHPVALWLAGISAQRKGDTRVALQYWQRAEPLFQQNPESQAELQGLITQAKQRLARENEQASASESISTAPEADVDGAAGQIKLQVSLDETLKNEVTDGDTLFVLARAIDGPPMPLAVVRRQAGDLPLLVILDDSMAMVPNMKLSQFDQVSVVAKISKSGQAKTASGDLQGKVPAVVPGTDTLVRVVISQRVP